MPEQKPPPKKKVAKRGLDVTRSTRAAAHLERLVEAKGKRLVVDLDEPARVALEVLLSAGYGSTQREVVAKALKAAAAKFKKA